MGTRGSKNNPAARGAERKNLCPACGEFKKWILKVTIGNRKMVAECKCGTFDKRGVKV